MPQLGVWRLVLVGWDEVECVDVTNSCHGFIMKSIYRCPSGTAKLYICSLAFQNSKLLNPFFSSQQIFNVNRE